MNPFDSDPDAPPAYAVQNTHAATSARATTEEEDPYDFLRTFDTVFLIDDSSSMLGPSWRETAEALGIIAPICTQRDADGIDIYFLNHPGIYKNTTSASDIIRIFKTVKPSGATPTGQRLNKILKDYLRRYKKDKTIKPMNIIVITDGVPSDDVESPIISAAGKLDEMDADPWQIGIQFFQVGKERDAAKHLQTLDDGLVNIALNHGKGSIRDIVDTVPFTCDGDAQLTADGILKVVTGAVNKRWDKSSKGIHLSVNGSN
jgi:hypothetical protein